jgi:hypothetical protein
MTIASWYIAIVVAKAITSRPAYSTTSRPPLKNLRRP